MSDNLITSRLIIKYPTMSSTARNWISCIPECKWVENYFNWLNEQILHINLKQREQLIKRLVDQDDNKFYEAIAELVYIAFWNYLKLSFRKDPKIKDYTPDFEVFLDRKLKLSFLSDVTVVRHNHPHEKIVINGESIDKNTVKLKPVTAPIQQSHRILMKIVEKFKKYYKILNNYHFVICLYKIGFENVFYLDDFQIRSALFGDLKLSFKNGESWYEPSIQTTVHNQQVCKGIFGFEEYKPLTAVITCDHEFYATSNTMLEKPKPHYPRKARFSFSIYLNPLGEWSKGTDDPFSTSDIQVNRLIDENKLSFCDPKVIDFY